MTRIKLQYVHEYRDRHGRLRHVRRPGSRRVALPGLPGSPEFMQAYQDAMTGAVLRPRVPKVGTLAALGAEFFGSTEFANLKPSSQAIYRAALAPVIERDGHRLVRDLPPDKARKIIQEIGATHPATTLFLYHRKLGYVAGDNAAAPSHRRNGALTLANEASWATRVAKPLLGVPRLANSR